MDFLEDLFGLGDRNRRRKGLFGHGHHDNHHDEDHHEDGHHGRCDHDDDGFGLFGGMGQTMECPRCHARARLDDRFCNGCGAAFVIAANQACPACGHRAQPGARFCPECGARLQ